jgi:amino acid transporter
MVRINEPEIKAPWAIFLAMLCTYVLGWLYNIVLAFCMGSPPEILESPMDEPVAQIYYTPTLSASAQGYSSTFAPSSSCNSSALQRNRRSL